MIIVILNEQQQ